MKYKLEIKPAIDPEKRHKIEDVLKKQWFHVIGGGTHTDMSRCHISFEDKPKGKQFDICDQIVDNDEGENLPFHMRPIIIGGREQWC